jgi:prevent-host-death family protein
LYVIQLSISEARKILPELVRRAARGEEIVVTHRGSPRARIVPLGRRIKSLDREEAKALLLFQQGRILQLGRKGPAIGADWKPISNGGGLTDQVLKDRR